MLPDRSCRLILRWTLGPGENLSSMAQLPKLHTLLVLTAGGLVVGLTYLNQTRRPHPIVDPIEANALHGGRMSLTDSVLVSLQSLLSCGFGLSLGIEGGFTQAAGAVGSKVGRLLKRRRHDVRMLVGAGAAGGIAGAFGAPFAGARTDWSSWSAVTPWRRCRPSSPQLLLERSPHTLLSATLITCTSTNLIWPNRGTSTGVALGIACGLLSVVLMRGVTATERLFHRSGLRLALGGARDGGRGGTRTADGRRGNRQPAAERRGCEGNGAARGARRQATGEDGDSEASRARSTRQGHRHGRHRRGTGGEDGGATTARISAEAARDDAATAKSWRKRAAESTGGGRDAQQSRRTNEQSRGRRQRATAQNTMMGEARTADHEPKAARSPRRRKRQTRRRTITEAFAAPRARQREMFGR